MRVCGWVRVCACVCDIKSDSKFPQIQREPQPEAAVSVRAMVTQWHSPVRQDGIRWYKGPFFLSPKEVLSFFVLSLILEGLDRFNYRLHGEEPHIIESRHTWMGHCHRDTCRALPLSNLHHCEGSHVLESRYTRMGLVTPWHIKGLVLLLFNRLHCEGQHIIESRHTWMGHCHCDI